MSALAGARIVNTRALHQAETLNDLLMARGAAPLAFPCIEVAPPYDLRPLSSALVSIADCGFAWIVFTSANGVFAVAEALGAARLPSTIQVAAIGETTADAVQTHLVVRSTLVPEVHSAAGLASFLPIRPGEHVLLPISAIARPGLANALRAKGATVTEVRAYRIVIGSGGVDLAPLLTRSMVSGIAFFSPSAVDGFARRIALIGCAKTEVESLPVACIGSTTAAQASKNGFQSVTTASQQTVPALVDALELALAPFQKGVLRCP